MIRVQHSVHLPFHFDRCSRLLVFQIFWRRRPDWIGLDRVGVGWIATGTGRGCRRFARGRPCGEQVPDAAHVHGKVRRRGEEVERLEGVWLLHAPPRFAAHALV